MGLYSREEIRRKGQIRASAVRKDSKTILAENFSRTTDRETFDIFLSHSYLDATEVLGLIQDFQTAGFSVYVDWVIDTQLDRTKVNRETAAKLRSRMRQCKSLVYAFSENSKSSVWMPWELGYFDAYRGKVAVLPVFQESQSDFQYQGQEYLGLYPYAFHATIQGRNGDDLIWVCTAPKEYKLFKDWFNGQ